MATVTVPRLGWTMEEGTLVEWFKRDGEAVRVGDALFALEGDKATETIEALDAGVLRITANAGEKVKVGQVVGQIEGDSPTSQGSRPGLLTAAPSGLKPGVSPEGAAVNSPGREPWEARGTRPSPRARRVAKELGVDPANLRGTGAGGRIRERDVRAAAKPTLAPTCQAIAARMLAGVTRTAPVTLTARADATNLVNLRGQFRTTGDVVPSYNDILLALTARVLRHHPPLRTQWHEHGLVVPDGCHVAFGVDTDAGLFAPVLRDADRHSLRQIARESRDLIERARQRRLSADDLRGATFTVTNLGMFGVEAFTPIITLPQCAVLGVGRIGREAAVVEERVVPRDILTLSLTFDHRVVDGAPAARFLDAVRKAVEAPAPWLLE